MNQKLLIGMIHLPPLLGFTGHPGLDYCIQKSLADLKTLEKAGFDAALIENDDDKPSTEFANSAQIANFAMVAYEVAKQAKIPIGVQVMLNDWKASIDIAKLVGADFIRIDVFVDNVTCEWGDIYPKTEEITAYRDELYPGLKLYTDIQVKHKEMLGNKSLEQSAHEAIFAGSDALIITGRATGQETPQKSLEMVKTAFPNFPVLVGAGINSANIKTQLAVADGAIIGSSIKFRDKISYIKASQLLKGLNE